LQDRSKPIQKLHIGSKRYTKSGILGTLDWITFNMVKANLYSKN